jgi:hypothetical protein
MSIQNNIPLNKDAYPVSESKSAKTAQNVKNAAVTTSKPVATPASSSDDEAVKLQITDSRQPEMKDIAMDALAKLDAGKLSKLSQIKRNLDAGYADTETVQAKTIERLFRDVSRLEAVFTAMQNGEVERFDELAKVDLTTIANDQDVIRETARRIVADLRKM